ncbi:MAG TPA: diguanylate cyclase, partial [Candidatus Faecivivens stercorigallinarum]|nr:diguanylate cyclase [Candidatus Faecivivens stercorigallinarum]
IGISVSPKDGTEYAELLRKADIALYTAKRAGKNIWRFFQPEMLEKTAGSVLSEID